VPGFIFLVAAVVAFTRLRSPRSDPEASIDALLVAVSTSVILLASVLADYYSDSTIPVAERSINAVYNVLALALLAMIARLAVGDGKRNRAWRLLALATAAILANELALILDVVGNPIGLPLTRVLSPLAFALATSAILDPTSPALTATSSPDENRFNVSRTIFLGFSVSTVPITLIGTRLAGSEEVHLSILSIGAFVLSCLTLFRIWTLFKARESISEMQYGLARSGQELLKPLSTSQTIEAGESAILAVLPEGTDFVVHLKTSDGTTTTKRSANVPVGTDSLPGQVFSIGDEGKYGSLTVFEHQVPLRPAEANTYRTLCVQIAQALASSEAVESRSEQRFRALARNSSDLIMVVRRDGRVDYMSEASERVLGYPASRFEGSTLQWVIAEEDHALADRYQRMIYDGEPLPDEIEIRIKHSDGEPRLFECTFTDMLEIDGVNGIVINAADVTDKRNLEEDLVSAASTDPLTLLLNRKAFIDEVSAAIRRASLTQSHVAVAIIDIDDFREINEGLGPVLADQLLVHASQSLRRAVRLSDSVARLSGDMFAILMPSVVSPSEAVASVERVLDELRLPTTVGDREFRLRASAGVVVDDDPRAEGVVLVRKADTSLDTAKQSHRGHVMLYKESMGEAASERIEIRNHFERAIREDELRLVYQPVVNLATGAIVGMEALARWEHPDRGNIPPVVFIPIAEKSGLINDLGDWALRTACNQLTKWQQQGITGISISVNVSGLQLCSDDFISRVRRIINETGVNPELLVAEITESVLIDDTDFIADRITSLRALGLRLAIDDFGTGYSSLSYLQRYHFDVLKIDRSFVTDIHETKNSRRAALIRAIIEMARALGAVTVAEGIEQVNEGKELASLGCDLAQGYLYYRPTEVHEIPALLAAESTSDLAA